jgi:hypothetical protein
MKESSTSGGAFNQIIRNGLAAGAPRRHALAAFRFAG